MFRLDPDLSIHKVIDGGLNIANGISWSPDDKTMYVTDTLIGIWAFDYDIANGTISNKRMFYPAEGFHGGSPDGHAVDVKGCIWAALYGGSKVVRISPQGEVIAEVLLPTKCLTDVAFAGEDIFVSTGKDGSKTESPASGGDIYRCHVGVKGLPLTKFKLPPSVDVESLTSKL